MKQSDIKFFEWADELEKRWENYQVKPPTYLTKEQYWAHRNCVLYDYEIHRLRQFNNPCRSCSIPMHLTKNFEVPVTGPICGLCYTLYSIVSEYRSPTTGKRYFYELHAMWFDEKRKRSSGTNFA